MLFKVADCIVKTCVIISLFIFIHGLDRRKPNVSFQEKKQSKIHSIEFNAMPFTKVKANLNASGNYYDLLFNSSFNLSRSFGSYKPGKLRGKRHTVKRSTFEIVLYTVFVLSRPTKLNGIFCTGSIFALQFV